MMTNQRQKHIIKIARYTGGKQQTTQRLYSMTDVTPSTNEINAARTGIYIQLRETTNLVNLYGSVANAVEILNLGDFIENQVQVVASSRAWVRRTENRLNKVLCEGVGDNNGFFEVSK